MLRNWSPISDWLTLYSYKDVHCLPKMSWAVNMTIDFWKIDQWNVMEHFLMPDPALTLAKIPDLMIFIMWLRVIEVNYENWYNITRMSIIGNIRVCVWGVCCYFKVLFLIHVFNKALHNECYLKTFFQLKFKVKFLFSF